MVSNSNDSSYYKENFFILFFFLSPNQIFFSLLKVFFSNDYEMRKVYSLIYDVFRCK